MAKVLLVDDDSSVLLTLAIALRRVGHAVSTADSAGLALEILEEERHTHVVCDVRMPGMTGDQLAAKLRTCKDPPQVILMSANTPPKIADDEIVAFVEKPIDTLQLHSLLAGT